MRAVLKGGELLLPHDQGDGVTLITADDPRYPQLRADAVADEDLNGTPEEDAALAARWARRAAGAA